VCPLCSHWVNTLFHADKRRSYLRCETCALVFVPPKYFLSAQEERREYDKHDNNTADLAYRHFLSRLCNPLVERLAPGATGLDFGCGPGPALACMLRESGMTVRLYDIFYAPDDSVFSQQYDFVCATEVVEHLHRPGTELARLWDILRGGGVLAVMTKLVLSAAAFTSWHYKNDPTHVCFFSEETWRWWAHRNGAEVQFVGADVILLSKAG